MCTHVLNINRGKHVSITCIHMYKHVSNTLIEESIGRQQCWQTLMLEDNNAGRQCVHMYWTLAEENIGRH